MLRFLLLTFTVSLSIAGERSLQYQPAPVDNPLRGLVPYMGDHREDFPHSLEFTYIALSDIIIGEKTYDWSAIEAPLSMIASRGHQAILRPYLEYPKKDKGIPAYLGMKIPDYESPKLRACLRDFIAAFGKKYDGDPRLGFLTAGLLGKWGEWHTYPETGRWAGRATQIEVLDAYEAAFQKTPILLRYPIGNDSNDASNASRPFGYHDDSFAWATLDTGKESDFWFYLPALMKAGPLALNKWQTQPIGGEIRPEAWGQVFDKTPANPRIQNFSQCVKEAHVTWLMDSGLFNEEHRTKDRAARAKVEVQKMGYEFHVPSVRWKKEGDIITVTIEIENRGVAPFYAEWPIEWGLLRDGKAIGIISTDDTLTKILPGETATRSCGIPFQKSETHLAIRIPNPMKGGIPVRFANPTQNEHAKGWLSLMHVPE